MGLISSTSFNEEISPYNVDQDNGLSFSSTIDDCGDSTLFKSTEDRIRDSESNKLKSSTAATSEETEFPIEKPCSRSENFDREEEEDDEKVNIFTPSEAIPESTPQVVGRPCSTLLLHEKQENMKKFPYYEFFHSHSRASETTLLPTGLYLSFILFTQAT